jgi:hypothetical protein
MKENKRIAAAIDLRVRQLNLPNLTLPGESNNHTGILQRSIGVATFGRNGRSFAALRHHHVLLLEVVGDIEGGAQAHRDYF